MCGGQNTGYYDEDRIKQKRKAEEGRMKKHDEYIVSTSKNVILAFSSGSEHETNADDTLPKYDRRCFTKAIKSKRT